MDALKEKKPDKGIYGWD